jgi:hypothetical protein
MLYGQSFPQNNHTIFKKQYKSNNKQLRVIEKYPQYAGIQMLGNIQRKPTAQTAHLVFADTQSQR